MSGRRGNVEKREGSYFDVLGLVTLSLPGPWWWHTEDLTNPNACGAIFRCYIEGEDVDAAYLLVVDVSGDAEEPDIEFLKTEDVSRIDALLERGVTEALHNDGRNMIRWMSSQLNEAGSVKSLVTAYIGQDHGKERQYIDVRTSVRGRKIIIGGCFDVARSSEFSVPIFTALKNAIPGKSIVD